MAEFLDSGNWAAVDQPGNPVPGSPEEIGFLANQFLDHSGQAWSHAGELSAVSKSNDGKMQGDYAASFESMLADLPARAGALSKGYGLSGSALSTFGQRLSTIQQGVGEALQQGTEADAQYRAALEDFSTYVPDVPEDPGDLSGIWRGLNSQTAQELAQPLAEQYVEESENPQAYEDVMQWASGIGQYAAEAEDNRQAAIGYINGCVTDYQDATGQCTSTLQDALSSLPQAGPASPL